MVSQCREKLRYFSACLAQNASGSASASRQRLSSRTLACAVNYALGGNVRPSLRRASIVESEAV
jgi:hypothetical protein